jgi:hypothetical protein
VDGEDKEVVPVLFLNTVSWRHMGDWQYSLMCLLFYIRIAEEVGRASELVWMQDSSHVGYYTVLLGE